MGWDLWLPRYTLKLMGNLQWITRVPATLKQAKQLLQEVHPSEFEPTELEGYRIAQHHSHYAGIEQRWYKGQQAPERGFRFLKDPLFFTSSVFLKTPQRVAALAMVMGLCLLIYTLGQRALRQALAQAKQGLRNQLGKSTHQPTLRWIFQCFQAVHLVYVDGQRLISNLTDERVRILSFLGSACQKYYLLI